jgi:hypothetical protein
MPMSDKGIGDAVAVEMFEPAGRELDSPRAR